ncbi:hypothetical protein N7467_007617 [Penicillium canescens]|nr:hypothetical protein N7467_007617 [Penicillium canescens]
MDDPSAPAALLAKLTASRITIDVLVNNAGFCMVGVLEQISDDEICGQVETLFFGPYRLVKAFVPGMRERRFGVVLNLSSGAGLDGGEGLGAYAAAAGDGLSKVLTMAPFNIPVLTAWFSTFNTGIGNAGVMASEALPGDYEASAASQVIGYLQSGAFAADGDKDKVLRLFDQFSRTLEAFGNVARNVYIDQK